MRKLIFAIFPLMLILSLTGCGTKRESSLDRVPNDAELLYTYTSTDTYGNNIITNSWSNVEDTGFFVVEIKCSNGSIQKLELKTTDGEVVSAFGNHQKDGIYITDLVTEASGDYVLYFGKADYFSGEMNVYFVSGVGYSTSESH